MPTSKDNPARKGKARSLPKKAASLKKAPSYKKKAPATKLKNKARGARADARSDEAVLRAPAGSDVPVTNNIEVFPASSPDAVSTIAVASWPEAAVRGTYAMMALSLVGMLHAHGSIAQSWRSLGLGYRA